jgi:hypothetical protein
MELDPKNRLFQEKLENLHKELLIKEEMSNKNISNSRDRGDYTKEMKPHGEEGPEVFRFMDKRKESNPIAMMREKRISKKGEIDL